MHDTYPLSEPPPLPVSRVQSTFAPQRLDWFDRSKKRTPRPDPQARWRRLLVFGGAAIITLLLPRELYYVPSVGRLGELEIALIVLFVINIAWLALSFASSLAGFAVMATGMRQSIID